jgi:hypothetical protein
MIPVFERKKTNECRVLVENQKEIDHKREHDVGGRIILKWVLDRERMGWIDLTQDRD